MSETNINLERHWVIFNPKAETPARMHKTYASAENEARMLAEKHIGDEFIIYESVASARLKVHVNTISNFGHMSQLPPVIRGLESIKEKACDPT